MKVLHIIWSVDPRGGGPIEGVFSSSLVWLKHGHQREIASLDPPDAPWVAKAPVKTFALGISGKWYAILRRIMPWLRYGYTPYLNRWLKSNARNYDAIIINGLWNYASFGSWLLIRKSGIPYFVFTHGMLDPWFNQAYPGKTFFKRVFWKLFEHRVLRDARGVLFTCLEEQKLASKAFLPYSAREFVVGYGALDVGGDPEQQVAAFFARLPKARGRKIILFLGRIHEKKGIDLLIRAFALHSNKFPDFDLAVAGPDQVGLQSSLAALASECDIADRVHWPGMLSGDAKWGAFRAAEFFALPSHQENFGIVIAEALALGKPVLITNKVNIWREIETGGAGIVVSDDTGEIASGLSEMCSLSVEQRQEMGARARECFEDHFDLEKNAMKLFDLLEQQTGRSKKWETCY